MPGAQNCDFCPVWDIEQNETNHNKANKAVFTAFCLSDNKNINHKAEHRYNANKYL